MFRFNWIIKFSIGLAILALMYCLAIFSLQLFSTYQEQHAYERRGPTSNDAQNAGRTPKWCELVIAIMSPEHHLCAIEPVTSDGEGKNAEYGLKAQLDMAEWAFGMLIVTVWIAIISIFGVLFVGWTLFATRRMAKDMRDIGNQQLRAYVEVGDARIAGKAFNFRMVIPLQNFGQTPARDFRFKYHIDFGNVPIPDFTDMPWKPAGGIPLAPGHSYDIICEEINITEAISNRLSDGPMYIIAGIAEYFDISGSRRETGFRLRVDPRRTLADRPTMSPENEGNYST